MTTISNFNENIILVSELSKNRIGVLFPYSLIIYSLYDLKEIYTIRLSKERIKNGLLNFRELKNLDIILWTPTIIFFFKLYKNNYALYQIINEYEQEINYYGSKLIRECYGYFINEITELKNGNLASCNFLGLTVYYKIYGKYVIQSKIKTLPVIHIIEIKPNKLFLIQRKNHEYRSGCFIEEYYSFSLSIIDIRKGKQIKLLEKVDERYDSRINFIIKDKNLLIRYGDDFAIYNIKEDILKKNDKLSEMRINYLCDYFDNYFLATDNLSRIKVYKFKNQSIEFYEDFPFQNIKGIIKLKSNKIIMYTNEKLEIINIL